MRPDFLRILSYAKKKGFYTILLTNATLITPEIADNLKDLGINRVDISLYGITPQTYEKITRIPGSFIRCLKGIQLLRQRNINVIIKMIAMTLNLAEFARIKAFAKNLGVRFQWDYLIHPRIDGSREPLRYRISPQDAIDLELRCQPHLFEEEKNPKKKKEPSFKKNGFFYCDAGKNSLAITPYGEMNLCLEYRFPQYDLRRGTVAQGWKELINYVKSTKPTSTYQCKDCELQEFCQWCPAVGWLEKKDRGACSPYYRELARIRRDRDKEISEVKAGKDDLSKPIREIFIEQLRKGNSIRMIIRGSSMHPFIKGSDMVTVKPIRFEETKVGDIVAYARNLHHGFTVHRLIRKSRDHEGRECLSIKGDANRYGDPPIYPEDVYGKVVTIERNGKSINFETRFRCSLGYLIAYLSYGLALGQKMVFQPHLSLSKIWHKVKG